MGPFRFRAQAALDLRRREYDDARRLLARVTLDLRAAEDVRREAIERLATAREQGAGALAGTDARGRWQWYQSWILRLERERDTCAADVEARQRDVAEAEAADRRARQRLESLERFRDKARLAWERAVAMDEQKRSDVFATLRHVAAIRESARRSRT